MREVQLVAAIVQEDFPILVLKDKTSSAAVPIWVSMPDFTSIFHAWRNWPFPRPLSHDLMKSLLEAGEMRVERVEVAEIKEGVFYAKLHVSKNGGEPKILDARPSDAIALALRVGAPIFVAEEVFAQAGIEWNPRELFVRLQRAPESRQD